jgi:hypothetical protein
MTEEVQSPPSPDQTHEEQPDGLTVRRRRRRRRRHRRRALHLFDPSQRFRLVLLAVVLLILIGSVAGKHIKYPLLGIADRLRTLLGRFGLHWEIVLLFFAAVILIYLLFASGSEDGLSGLFNPSRRTRRR